MSLVAAWVVLTRQRIVTRLFRRLIGRNIGRRYFELRLSHVSEIEDRIFGFVGHHSGRVLPLLALEIIYHVAAVTEIWVALGLMTGAMPSLLTAFVLEYVNRTITVLFQFVPMWLGVDEAGTGLMTTVLHLGPAAGVSLALVRKGRLIGWTTLGIALLLQQGFSLRGTVREADRLAADP